MPETRAQNSDLNRAFGDAKEQAAGVIGELSDAAQDLYGQAPMARLMRPQGQPGKRPVLLRKHCATRLRISHIRLS